MSTIYYGMSICEKEGCKRKAYYQTKDGIRCGAHSMKIKSERTELPKMKKEEKETMEKEKQSERDKIIEEQAKKNRELGKKGHVIVSKLLMMREAEYVEGYLRVYPNFKHQNKKDGYGCMKLSPKSLGPVIHGQPNLPNSKNIENFHQGSKCFPQELDEKGNPGELYYKNRREFYEDEVPHRHKYKGVEKNKNIPAFFVWVDKEGKEHHLGYVESRQFYCHFYERLCSKEPDFTYLQNKIKDGYNVQIIGYDGDPMNNVDIEKAYLDPSKPFGHEKVLYAMLTLPPNEYPWKKYKTFDF